MNLFRSPWFQLGCILLAAGAGWRLLLAAGAHRAAASQGMPANPAGPGNPQTSLARPQPDSAALPRGPVAIAVSANRAFCATANRALGTISLFAARSLTALDEVIVPGTPADVAWVDDTLLAAALKSRRALALLEREEASFTRLTLVELPDEPRGLATCAARDESGQTRRFACVALPHADLVAVVDVDRRALVQSLPTAPQPVYVALSADGAWLATSCAGSGELCVHERATGKLLSRRAILDDPANLGVPAITPDGAECIVPHLANRAFPVNEENIEKGWVIDNRLTKFPLPAGEYWRQQQMGLDTRGDAVGDAHACAISGDGAWLAVTCGGTHEVLILSLPRIPWPASNPGDFIPSELLGDHDRFRRVILGGRPQGAVFLDARTLLVANDLGNCVQAVDAPSGAVAQTTPLCATALRSAAQRGEEIFYDAERSLNGWFSCHTCHVDGHTSERLFDTLNDGSYDTYKLTPSLRGVAETGPWTWHGWQTDLKAALRKSMKETMRSTRPFTEAEVEDLYEFLRTLPVPPNPHWPADGNLRGAAERGRRLFEGKAGCNHCHHGRELTSPSTYDVGTGSRRYVYKGFNPPSLRGLYQRRRFLHDGRAGSLVELIERHHQPNSGSEGRLDAAEIQDLLAYLKLL